ncbi:hypothetical protein PR003_g18954 [Phytophthora rubi]|uniref:Uncharacterized protein n=1 Tax=Phytophthora rubi TaxID=129364 RepID=A0A6A4DZK2_9STRA|nr:hypothetical protein PR003_g18954 [Phytophthora rubi]
MFSVINSILASLPATCARGRWCACFAAAPDAPLGRRQVNPTHMYCTLHLC